MFAERPLDATLTERSVSEELKMSKWTRFDSMSLRSSALPLHESEKSLTHVLAGIEELAKSERN